MSTVLCHGLDAAVPYAMAAWSGAGMLHWVGGTVGVWCCGMCVAAG